MGQLITCGSPVVDGRLWVIACHDFAHDAGFQLASFFFYKVPAAHEAMRGDAVQRQADPQHIVGHLFNVEGRF